MMCTTRLMVPSICSTVEEKMATWEFEPSDRLKFRNHLTRAKNSFGAVGFFTALYSRTEAKMDLKS